MPNCYIYADEAGDFTFSRKANVSKYFIIATIVTTNWREPAIGLEVLRKTLISDGLPVGNYFHATTDAQTVRDRVYKEIMKYDFSIQATICEKSKAQPQVTKSKTRFYKVPWHYHAKIGIAPLLNNPDKIMLTVSALGTKKEKKVYRTNLIDIEDQNFNAPSYLDFRPCATDPCLQIADYCAWAIQRKWEINDERSYDLIKDRITREYDIWNRGDKHYY